jgi:hypothetical protein
LQGASATETLLDQVAGRRVRVWVIWEPVLMTDWGPPSTATLGRIHDPRAAQFWDRRRLISRSMGGRGVVWDHIAVYPAGPVWEDRPPPALYAGGPVVRVISEARAALLEALQRAAPPSSSRAGGGQYAKVSSCLCLR